MRFFHLPLIFMSDSSSGAMTAVVAIIAIVVILGLGFFLFQNFQGGGDAAPSINVDLPTGQSQ